MYLGLRYQERPVLAAPGQAEWVDTDQRGAGGDQYYFLVHIL
jgi:hypothetical protein